MKTKQILTTLLLTFSTVFSRAVIIPSMANDIRQERVQFKSGTTSAVKEGTIKGYQTVDYILNVKKGQSGNISLASKSGFLYFNILEPEQNEVAIFVGSTSGNQFEGTFNKSGDYKIRVYLMRNAARENKTANYRLEMIVN